MMEKLRRGSESLGAAWRRLWDKVTAKIPRLSRPWSISSTAAQSAASRHRGPI